jgi:hypothetical protein
MELFSVGLGDARGDGMSTQTTCDRCGEVNPADVHTCTPTRPPNCGTSYCSCVECVWPPSAPAQDLPFGVGGGLVAIKTLLSRDPCVHANTAIEMIDAILKKHPAAQPAPTVQEPPEDELTQALIERDEYHAIADELAEMIAKITGEDIGEHTSANFPWRNALDAAENWLCHPPAAQPAPVQEPVAWAWRAFDPDDGHFGKWGTWHISDYKPPRQQSRWFQVVPLPNTTPPAAPAQKGN